MNWSMLLVMAVLLAHGLKSVDAFDDFPDAFDDEEEQEEDNEEEEEVFTDARLQLHFNYHNYEALTAFLHDVAAHYPTLTHLYSIGQSVQGSLFSPPHDIDFISN